LVTVRRCIAGIDCLPSPSPRTRPGLSPVCWSMDAAWYWSLC
jgi:hypothetical protein